MRESMTGVERTTTRADENVPVQRTTHPSAKSSDGHLLGAHFPCGHSGWGIGREGVAVGTGAIVSCWGGFAMPAGGGGRVERPRRGVLWVAR
jgi:hypothetical protein